MRKALFIATIMVFVLVACTGGGSDEPSQSATSGTSATAQAADPTQLTGTWTGKLMEPGIPMWSTKLEIQQCVPDSEERCGRMRLEAEYPQGSGKTMSCSAGLIYRGVEKGAFVFDEQPMSGGCVAGQLSLQLLPSGDTVAAEENVHGTWITYGTLLNSAASR